MHLLWEL